MADEIVIRLPGKPVGKGRPRFTMSGRTYTDPKTRGREDTLAALAVHAMQGRHPLTGPVAVEVIAAYPIPKSWSRKKREAALAGQIVPTVTPDADNILKTVDAFNGIVWDDDKQVVEALVMKVYGERPFVEFRVRAIVEREAA